MNPVNALLLALILTAPVSAQSLALRAPGTPVVGTPWDLALFGPDLATSPYVLLLANRIGDGVDLGGGRVLALEPDALTDYALAYPSGPLLSGFSGFLDGTGRGQAQMHLPPDPALAGSSFHVAGISLDPTAAQGIGGISNTLRRAVAASAPTYDWSAVDHFLATRVDQLPLPANPGLALAIVKDGEILFEQHYGPWQASTRVRLASATKWVTAAAILGLVEDGLVGLDDPVSLYLPEFTGDKAGITLRHCLAMTSGLPGQASCLGNTNTTLAACVSQIAQGPLLAPPGSEFHYGGASFQVAGRVAEVVTGLSFELWFRLRYAQPLGIDGFAYDLTTPTLNPRLAGGGRCRVGDYARILLATLEGGALELQVLQTVSILEQRLDQTQGAAIVGTPQPDDRRYGLGVWRDEVGANGEVVVYSSPGAFGTTPWIDLSRGYGAVLLIDQSGPIGRAITEELRPLIEAQLPVLY